MTPQRPFTREAGHGQGPDEVQQGSAQTQGEEGKDHRRQPLDQGQPQAGGLTRSRESGAASATERGEEACVAVLALLRARAAGATICPSEAARALAAAHGAEDWRAEMAEVHAAVDRLVAEGLVRLSWRGEPMPARNGPYRIARVERG